MEALAPKVTFRPMQMADLPAMHEWTSRPHVAEWWGEESFEELEEEFAPVIAGVPHHQVYVALGDGEPIGFIQSYVPALCHDDGWWLDEHDPGVRGIDQFLIDGDKLDRGLGTHMVRAFVARLFVDPSVTRIQTDPDPDNARAIRCYEKSGFRRVGEVETLDGVALLMYCERP